MRSLLIVLSLAALAACASPRTPSSGRGMDGALMQPMRDLSLLRDAAPEVLQRAAANPYDLASVGDCRGVAAELAALDVALGPDVDLPGVKEGMADGLAADLLRGAVALPFRGVVRQITGAQKRDTDLRAAVLAGMVRRGFLKGRASAAGCGAPVIQIKAAAP